MMLHPHTRACAECPHPDPPPDYRGRGLGRGAFSLVELLIVIGLLGVLIALMIPALGKARESARRAMCASNLRQLHMASLAYATDNRGYFPPAHYDFVMKNLHRWHGTRATVSQPFDFAGSPLKKYLQVVGIRQCPSFEAPRDGFEQSAGGYGYNDRFIGSSIDEAVGPISIAKKEANFGNVPAKISMISHPGQTIMFADSAMANPNLIEYSFVEAPVTGKGFPTSPSIHFRHSGMANVIWVDGHVTSHLMEWTYPTNIYGAPNEPSHLGFFGPRDNSLFDRD